MRTSLGRELAIALRARVTWGAATIAALVVGHGFVLAMDVFSSSSRSALGDVLMRREMDPLAGVVRPTLGGAELAVAVLVPVVAARVLSVEKERRTFGAMAIAAGSPWAVVVPKIIASIVASMLVVVPAIATFAVFAGIGGHLDGIEVAIAVLGHMLHAALSACVAIAAAAWTRTTAQATTAALVASLASWVVSAGEGFAALAWMGPLERLSVSRVLAPFEQGIVSVGSIAWIAVAITASIAAAAIGARFDLAVRSRVFSAVLLLLATALSLDFAAGIGKAYDWTEMRRASLPPAVVDGLRAIPEPIRLQVWLDREDSRRRQIERDALAKLRLARSDIAVEMPLDDGSSSVARDEAYGRILIFVGDRSGETRSASRKEIVTRVFEIAVRPVPDFAQAAYPGYPLALGAAKSRLVRIFAYGVVPAIVLAIGAFVTRRRRTS